MRCWVIILLTLLLIPVVSADLGPKPTADISITLNGQNVPDNLFYAKMLTCEKGPNPLHVKDLIAPLNISEYDAEKDCYWKPAPLAWGGCQDSNCGFSYFLPRTFRLAVYLPSQDKIYVSPEVERENFRSTFDANLLPDGQITIRESTPFAQSDTARNLKTFFFAFVLTLFLELLVALIFVSRLNISKNALVSVLIVNVISLPIVWFVFPLLKSYLLSIVFGELFAFLFEGYFIFMFNKNLLSLKKSLLLSFFMNIVSFVIGGLLSLLHLFY